jgi:UDP-galactopyranose mutase
VRGLVLVAQAGQTGLRTSQRDRRLAGPSRFIESAESVATQSVVDVPYGYPIPTHARAEAVSRIKRYLEGLRIHSIGRFGSWDYANSDECIRQGLDLGGQLLEHP